MLVAEASAGLLLVTQKSLNFNNCATLSASEASKRLRAYFQRVAYLHNCNPSPYGVSKMHYRSRSTSHSLDKSVHISLVITLSLLTSLCAPFMIRRAQAALTARVVANSALLAQGGPTPTPAH